MNDEIHHAEEILDRIEEDDTPTSRDLEYFLGASNQTIIERLYSRADSVRNRHIGDEIYMRGLIEFSSFCRNRCFYCGLNRNNTSLARYRMTSEEILKAVDTVASCRISTVVLQSGEDDSLDHIWMRDLIAEIRNRHNMAVTLSLGEWEYQAYALWKEAGANRYLLKIETTDSDLYDSLHPGMSHQNRFRCLSDLRSLGYEVGSGIIVGLRGQTVASLCRDIQFFKEEDLDMIGIGPFISHPSTELCKEPSGDAEMTLRVLALTRIVTKTTNIPATTAIASIDDDFRSQALKCGANVVMPIFTPVLHKSSYEIYPDRSCTDEEGVQYAEYLSRLAASLNRHIDYSKGDRKKQ